MSSLTPAISLPRKNPLRPEDAYHKCLPSTQEGQWMRAFTHHLPVSRAVGLTPMKAGQETSTSLTLWKGEISKTEIPEEKLTSLRLGFQPDIREHMDKIKTAICNPLGSLLTHDRRRESCNIQKKAERSLDVAQIYRRTQAKGAFAIA